jgi:hypothetical protein
MRPITSKSSSGAADWQLDAGMAADITLDALFRRAFRVFADRTAVTWEGGQRRYREVGERFFKLRIERRRIGPSFSGISGLARLVHWFAGRFAVFRQLKSVEVSGIRVIRRRLGSQCIDPFGKRFRALVLSHEPLRRRDISIVARRSRQRYGFILRRRLTVGVEIASRNDWIWRRGNLVGRLPKGRTVAADRLFLRLFAGIGHCRVARIGKIKCGAGEFRTRIIHHIGTSGQNRRCSDVAGRGRQACAGYLWRALEDSAAHPARQDAVVTYRFAVANSAVMAG